MRDNYTERYDTLWLAVIGNENGRYPSSYHKKSNTYFQNN